MISDSEDEENDQEQDADDDDDKSGPLTTQNTTREVSPAPISAQEPTTAGTSVLSDAGDEDGATKEDVAVVDGVPASNGAEGVEAEDPMDVDP